MGSLLGVLGDVWEEMERVDGADTYEVLGELSTRATAEVHHERVVLTAGGPRYTEAALLTAAQARALAARLLVLALRMEQP